MRLWDRRKQWFPQAPIGSGCKTLEIMEVSRSFAPSLRESQQLRESPFIKAGRVVSRFQKTHNYVAEMPVASGITVPDLTSNTSRRVVGQWGGAGGALCEEVNSGEGVGHRVWRRFTRLAQSD